MELQEVQERIRKLMSRFVTDIKSANAMGWTDINHVSENVLIPLFSKIYEHTELKNLNVSEGSNFPAIDLGDKEKRTAYQITSERSSEKIKKTLRKFIDYKLYKEYDRLVIYILAEKQSRYQGTGFDEIIDGKFTFDKENDIRDYQDLLREISGFSLEKSLKVLHILEQHFGDGNKQDDDEPQDILEWLEQVNSLWEEESGPIKINREELRNDLQDFALQGNGVVIGSPGVGKTYLLKELHQHLKSNEIPHLLLPIDRLGDGTPEDLQDELSYKGNLIEKLKSVPISDQKAILLFDAFDAARDERTRKNFLRLIRRAIHELSESWNIVVTVRTYDAMKSQALLDLFGDPDDTQHQSDRILCRHFTILPFDKDEVLQALKQIKCPQYIYNENSKDILANPFNLWLLEKILRNLPDKDLATLSQIRSEVQLFNLFWYRRIETADNEIDRLSVLEGIALEMVKQRSLSIKQSDVRKTLIQTAWDDLLSDEILAKVSSSGQRIAFSHNILFDYAISVLLIDDEPQHLEDFILEDASRPLFLRPSLTYFFTRLWYYDDSTNFWRAFWHILQRDQSVPLRLVARLVPTSVIANEASDIKQLTPFLEKIQNGEEIASKAIMWLFQSLRTLQIERDALWVAFFDQVSVYLHNEFAWEVATLTSDILERATEANVEDTCGRIGRRLLGWVWQKRQTREGDWYDRLGGRWAVPLVAKTYHTNMEESRALLEKVLQLTKEENFPIDFLSQLTEYVETIWDHDPEFVTSIHLTVFTHYETSNERIIRGGSIFPMATSRHQAYGLCQYRLIRHLPNFLRSSPLIVTRAVVQSLNLFIIRTSPVKNPQRDIRLEDLIERFDFRGKSGGFAEDGYISDAERSMGKPIETSDILFEFIAELAKSEDSRLDSILDVFCDEVVVAFLWKRLLKTAAQFPKVFAPCLFELCIAKPIQLHLETSYELGLFLEAAAPEFTPDKLLRIEESILAIPESTEDNREYLEMCRNRLLAQIPMNLLSTDEGKKIWEEMVREDKVPPNQPHLSFSITKEPITEEKRFQDKGIDTSSPENQELHRFFKPLNEFSSEWMNDEPTMEASKLILPKLQEAHAVLKSDTAADKGIINSLWHKLTDCVAILGRIANTLESESFTFCRQVLLEGTKHEDPLYDDQSDSSAYSPYPRHAAASGLLRLAFHQPDPEILDAIEILASDPVRSVRMVTAMELTNVYVKSPERFWHIMDNRAIERNHVVQEYLYFTLNHVVAIENQNEAKTTRIMAKLLEHTPLPSGRQGLSDPFADLLMWLAIDRQNSWALKIIEDKFLKDPIQYANILTRIVNEVMEDYIVPKHLETLDGRERARRTIEWLEKVIDVVSNRIGELYKILKEHQNEKEHETEEVAKQLHDTYEVIELVITCLYYQVAHEETQSEKQTPKISPELRCEFYNEVKPLMKQVIDFAQNPEYGLMFAPTAHYFMKLLTSFLSCNPKEVLHLAEGVVKSSEQFGYNLDAIAIMDVVEFVEIVLADYRHEVRDDEECLEDLLNLLDMFAKTGWTDALKLVWRLDEVFR